MKVDRDEFKYVRNPKFMRASDAQDVGSRASSETLIYPGCTLDISDRWRYAVKFLTEKISVSLEPSFDSTLFRDTGGMGR